MGLVQGWDEHIPVQERRTTIPELPGSVNAGGRNRDGYGVFEALECPDDEGAVGPGAWEANVKVEVLAGNVGGGVVDAEFGGGSRVTTGRVGRGHLGHHEVPGGGPGGADGGDEELGREGLAPEELGDGSYEVGIGIWGVLIQGHSFHKACFCGFGYGVFLGRQRWNCEQ